jgi:hypothetical protein
VPCVLLVGMVWSKMLKYPSAAPGLGMLVTGLNIGGGTHPKGFE